MEESQGVLEENVKKVPGLWPLREPLIKSGFLNIVHGLHGLTRNSGNKTLLIRVKPKVCNPGESVDPFDNAE